MIAVWELAGEIIIAQVVFVLTMIRNATQIAIHVETGHAILNAEKINIIVLKIAVLAVKMNALIRGN